MDRKTCNFITILLGIWFCFVPPSIVFYVLIANLIRTKLKPTFKDKVIKAAKNAAPKKLMDKYAWAQARYLILWLVLLIIATILGYIPGVILAIIHLVPQWRKKANVQIFKMLK